MMRLTVKMATKAKLWTSNSAKELTESMKAWAPNPGPQTLVLALLMSGVYRILLYGGARGGGKTEASLISTIERVNKTLSKQLIIRKNAKDLQDYWLRLEQLGQGVEGLKFSQSKYTAIRRLPGVLSTIFGGHLKDDQSYMQYQGQQFDRICIEELTQIPTERRFNMLISSCRSSNRLLKPVVFCTANPGGPGHSWVKSRFVEPDSKIYDTTKKKYTYVNGSGEVKVVNWLDVENKFTGERSAYIPATVDDNPVLLKNDPEYVRTLDSLEQSDPELYRAWRHGDWNVAFGAVFEEWRNELHTFSTFDNVTKDDFDNGYKLAGMDWGYNDECVMLWAFLDEVTEKHYRNYIYREAHGNHQPPSYHAKKFAEIQKIDPVAVFAMPHDAYSHLGGWDKIVDVFKAETDKLPVDKRPMYIRADKLSVAKRLNAIANLHQLMQVFSDGKPLLMVHRSCDYTIKTLPTITYASDSFGERIANNCADHALDALCYTLMVGWQTAGSVTYKDIRCEQKNNSYYEDGNGVPASLMPNLGALAAQSL